MTSVPQLPLGQMEILLDVYKEAVRWDAERVHKSDRGRAMSFVIFGVDRTMPYSTWDSPSAKDLSDLMWEFDREFIVQTLNKLFPDATLFETEFPKTQGTSVSLLSPIYVELALLGVPYFVTKGTQMVKGGGGSSQPKKIIFLSETDMVLGAAALAGL